MTSANGPRWLTQCKYGRRSRSEISRKRFQDTTSASAPGSPQSCALEGEASMAMINRCSGSHEASTISLAFATWAGESLSIVAIHVCHASPGAESTEHALQSETQQQGRSRNMTGQTVADREAQFDQPQVSASEHALQRATRCLPRRCMPGTGDREFGNRTENLFPPQWTVANQASIALRDYVAAGPAGTERYNPVRDERAPMNARRNVADLVSAGWRGAHLDSCPIGNGGLHAGALDGRFDRATRFTKQRSDGMKFPGRARPACSLDHGRVALLTDSGRCPSLSLSAELGEAGDFVGAEAGFPASLLVDGVLGAVDGVLSHHL